MSSASEGSTDDQNSAAAPMAEPVEEEASTAPSQPETESTPQQAPGTEGRRTQLRIVRENIGVLSQDIGSFRRSHDAGIKRLQKQVDSLRSELGAAKLSKDVGSLRKSHDASAKRLEKQVSTLRNDVATLKASMAKDAARARARQDAVLQKILAKVSTKPKAAAASKPRKKTSKK